MVNAVKSQKSKGSALEELSSLFDKAHSVADCRGTDTVHKSRGKASDNRPSDSNIFNILNENYHILKHCKSDTGGKSDSHQLVAVIREYYGIKENRSGLDNLL